MADYKITLELTQQSPMLHFQTNDRGVCIRGSELKPKLDKFLVPKIEEDLSTRGEKVDLTSFCIGDAGKKALDYKVRIFTKGEVSFEQLCGMYYGDNSAKLVSWKTPICIEIFCFNPKVQPYLSKDNLCAFFICTNFGRMTSKGYGSFRVSRFNGKQVQTQKPEEYAAILKKQYGIKSCIYRLNYGSNGDYRSMMNAVNDFYRTMKAGQSRKGIESYLAQYFEKKGIQGEKPFINATILHLKNARLDTGKKYRYIRAVLGTAGAHPYMKPFKTTVSISNDAIERFPSPILFKILEKTIFVVPMPKRLKETPSILGQKFKFSKGGNEKSIYTPDSFDLEDFLKFCTYKNKNLQSVEVDNGK